MKTQSSRSQFATFCLALAAGLISSVGVTAVADPVYTTTVTVPYNPNAGSGNFDSPTVGSNTTAYTVQTGADANNFYVNVSAPTPNTDISAYQFANVYITSPGKADGLIFEVTNSKVYSLNDQSTYLSLANTGYTYTSSTNNISFSVPFSFLESDPLGKGFTVGSGDLVRISYSQSFGYTFVGGSANYTATMRLGGQVAPNAVPEPSAWALLTLGIGGLLAGILRRRGALAA